MPNLTDKPTHPYPLSLILGRGLMADEAADTMAGGMRATLGVFGFLLPMAGIDQLTIAEHPVAPWWVSAALIAAGPPLLFAPAIWRHWHERRALATRALTNDLRNATPMQRAPSEPQELSLQAAAQIAYEQAERDGWLENVSARGDYGLEFFKFAMLLQAQHYVITLSGKGPPSGEPYPIAANRIAGLHPMKGENTLHRGSVAGQVEFRDVTISAVDLDKVIAIYRALATGEADLIG